MARTFVDWVLLLGFSFARSLILLCLRSADSESYASLCRIPLNFPQQGSTTGNVRYMNEIFVVVVVVVGLL